MGVTGGRVLQRKCDCGGPAKSGGECTDCREKRELQRQAAGPATATASGGPTPSAHRHGPDRGQQAVARSSGLTIGDSQDSAEREADRVAAEVTSARSSAPPTRVSHRVQRQTGSESGSHPAAPTSVDQTLAEPGNPLAPTVQQDLGQRFGHDFSRVRVHVGASAEQSARAVNAHAYTVGRDIVFGAGRFAPETDAGRRLLAHELTHVIQQGAAEGSTPGLVQRDESEAEAGAVNIGSVEPSTSVATPPPEFGPQAAESGCPPAPTGLGDLPPDPPCPTTADDISGSLFFFCLDSDVFRDQQQVEFLRRFARSQRADSMFKVHGYASTLGASTYNWNLSCHRAKRAARELQNAGVPSEQIEIAARGETSNYGPTQADNQMVLIGAYPPSEQPTPAGDTPTTPRAIVDRAVERLQARDYRLAADAYLDRWTCGLVPNLGEMARRLTIKIQGEPPADVNPQNLMGTATSKGRHEIWLGRELFTEPGDPLLCAIARIVDLGFHIFAARALGLPVENQGLLHSGAIFLVELAGFPPCETPARFAPGVDVPVIPARTWWTRPTTDPLAATDRDCPDEPPLPGAITPQPVRVEQPSRFTVTDFRPEFGEAPVDPEVNVAKNVVRAEAPSRAFAFDAEATAKSNPAQASRYQVGFLQTVVADETTAEYVDGKVVHLSVPVPIRDGPGRELDQPPWYMPPLVTVPDAQGVAQTRMSDAPSASAAYEFLDFTKLGRGPASKMRQSGNVLNQLHRETTFHTWLAARRPDAPLDRFNTQFLEGREVQFTLDVDVVGEQATGQYKTDIATTALADSSPMQLSGPTPAEYSNRGAALIRITEVTPPTPRAEAGGMSIEQIRTRVRQVADELEPLRIALHLDGPIMVRTRFDRASGRMIIDTPERRASSVEETGPAEDKVGVTATGREELAHEFTVRLRKDLIAAPDVPDLSDGIPTSINRPLPSYTARRRQQGDPNPYDPQHGIGLLAALREQAELDRSAQQLRNTPNDYDPTFWPDVQVELERENYCYDFRVSGLDIPEQCVDESMRTVGCVRPYSSNEYTLRVLPRFVTQQRAGETFRSPVALRVVTFPMKFVLFTAREGPGGDTFNHEMHHMIDSFNQVQALKERMARRIRARLMEVRRLAAENPRLKEALLSQATLDEIATQENEPFVQFFQRVFKARGDVMHTREAQQGLPPYRSELPPQWTTYREPAFIGGRTGSLDDKACR